MSSITIRGCCIGAGRPKVILPIVARTEDDILREARRLSALKADCIEWRADWFSDALDAAALKRVLSVSFLKSGAGRKAPARDLPYQSRGWRNLPDAAAIR